MGPSMQEQVLILEPGRTEKNYWTDLWRYRELFLILAWRDLSVRYKQTVIGVALGDPAAVSDHGGVHGDLWPRGRAAQRWAMRPMR